MGGVDENSANTKSISDRFDDWSQQRGSTTAHCDDIGKAGNRGTGRKIAVEKMECGFICYEVLGVGEWRNQGRGEGKLRRREEEGRTVNVVSML